jgi:hypothetical protein
MSPAPCSLSTEAPHGAAFPTRPSTPRRAPVITCIEFPICATPRRWRGVVVKDESADYLASRSARQTVLVPVDMRQ